MTSWRSGVAEVKDIAVPAATGVRAGGGAFVVDLRAGGFAVVRDADKEATVETLEGYSAASADRGSSCAIKGGRVTCGGRNDLGQLGRGDRSDSDAGAPVTGIDDATSVATGLFFTCATRKAGNVSCWGSAHFGTLGAPPDHPGAHALAPVPLPGVHDARRLFAGPRAMCAAETGGDVVCWGDTWSTGAFARDLSARRRGASQIALGKTHGCALRDGRIVCWGSNAYGALGDRSVKESAEPVRIAF